MYSILEQYNGDLVEFFNDYKFIGKIYMYYLNTENLNDIIDIQDFMYKEVYLKIYTIPDFFEYDSQMHEVSTNNLLINHIILGEVFGRKVIAEQIDNNPYSFWGNIK